MKIFLIFLAMLNLFTATVAFASDDPVLFYAEKSGLQILPLRFEYKLLDPERLQLGDILIDAKKLRFQIVRTKKDKKYHFRFIWPAALSREGEVTLLNNYGKALWSQEYDEKTILPPESERDPLATAEGPDLMRNQQAQVTSDGMEKENIDQLKILPFMKFCIFRKDKKTRFKLCSKEFYLTTAKDGKILIKDRVRLKANPIITVNEIDAGSQGMISLNNPKETIIFKATLISGANIEIETRMKPVEFHDVSLDDDGKTVKIVGSGAFPVRRDLFEIRPDGRWLIKVPADYPVIYLFGEGDIPIRQEFFVRSALPTSSVRLFHGNPAPVQTYKSSVDLSGSIDKNATLTSKMPNSKVQVGGGVFEWELSSLKTGSLNARYLAYQPDINDPKEFVVYHKIYRGYRYEVLGEALYLTPIGTPGGYTEINWWFDDLRWGAEASYLATMAQRDKWAQTGTSRFAFKWRAHAGLRFEEPTWGLKIEGGRYSTRETPIGDLNGVPQFSRPFTAGMFGFGVFAEGNLKKVLFNTYRWDLDLLGAYGGSELQPDFAGFLSARFFSPVTQQLRWYVGGQLFGIHMHGNSDFLNQFQGLNKRVNNGNVEVTGSLGISYAF